MIYPVVIFGTFWFWAALTVFVVAMIALAENDNWEVGLPALVVFAFLWAVFGPAEPFQWASHHWWSVIALIIGYIFAGVFYSVFRWWALVRDPASYTDQNRVYDANSYKLTPDGTLDVSRYKERIITWMTLWWASLFWYLMRFPRRIFTVIYNEISGLLDRIARMRPKP